jgi:hypothetical protein
MSKQRHHSETLVDVKRRLLPHVCWALVALVAFILGSFTTGQHTEKTGIASPGEATGGKSSTLDSRSAAVIDAADVQPAISLSLEKAKVLTFDALAEPNRIDRLRRLCNLLAQVSPENWRGVIEGFERQKTFEGREYQEEWGALERIDEVAAATAVEDTLRADGLNRNESAAMIFTGWTGHDPDAAMAWYNTQTSETQERLRFALLEGLARSAPERALALSETSKLASLDQNAFPIVRGAIQRGGFASAEQLLEVLRHRPDATDGFKHQVFSAISEKKLLMSSSQGNPLDSLHWLGGYLGNDSTAG